MGQKAKKYRARRSSPSDREAEIKTVAIDGPESTSAARVGMPYRRLMVCGLLLLAVTAVFAQTGRHDFINYDDDDYVYENRHVRDGLTVEGTAWAIAAYHSGNWHPLTWLSHELDCQLYGLKPGGHHLTNLILQAAATILLFLALERMTAALWRSALVAAVFAIHPLRVESVAWVAERKDVLCGLFFMLTLWCYARYVQRPASRVRYLLVVAAFTLGLAAKPMIVTLPFVLLLLDFWPLRRGAASRERGAGSGEQGAKAGWHAFTPPTACRHVGREHERKWAGSKEQESRIPDLKSQIPAAPLPPFSLSPFPARSPLPAPRSLLSLFIEKIPLFALTAASCVVTLAAQRGAMKPLDRMDFPWRVANAAVAYVAYLGKMFYPAGLAVFYPLPNSPPPALQVVAAVSLLLAISMVAFLARRKCPYLLCGWLWYLGTLVPVIGLVQVGSQAMADRYTYLAQIGLYIAVAWGAADLCAAGFSAIPFLYNTKPGYPRGPFAAVSALLVAALLVGGWRQTALWHDSRTLWTHALACTSQNPIAHNSLGNVLADSGQVEDAIAHYRQALEIESGYAAAHHNLARALAGRGEASEAIAHYRLALAINPDYAEADANLGIALAGRGEVEDAIAHYRRALAINPELVEAHNNLGNALAGRGQIDDAIACYRHALEITPGFADAYYNLGTALAGRGQIGEAMDQFRQVLAIKPDHVEAHASLGNLLASRGEVAEAIAQYRHALAIKPDYAEAQFNLGYALVGRGEVEEAIAHYRRALAIKPSYAEAHYNLASVLAARGEVEEAIAHYRDALANNPGFVEARTNLGNALAGEGKFAEAVAEYEKALAIEPGLVEAHTNLGCALASLGRIDEATGQYHKALEINPKSAEAHFNLGHILAGHGHADEAIVHYRQALKCRPDYAEAHNNLGNELAARGEFDAAIVHYRKAVKIEPDNVRAHYNLGSALASRGKREEARQQYRQALRLAIAQNDPATAEVVRTCLKLDPSAPAGKVR